MCGVFAPNIIYCAINHLYSRLLIVHSLTTLLCVITVLYIFKVAGSISDEVTGFFN
jgi:hypothetical protein